MANTKSSFTNATENSHLREGERERELPEIDRRAESTILVLKDEEDEY